jgi:hypothetical protein
VTLLTARVEALYALLTPFIVAVLLLIACAVWLVAHLDRQPRIGRTSPDTEARRAELHRQAFGGRQ